MGRGLKTCESIPLRKMVKMIHKKTLIDLAVVLLAFILFVTWYQNRIHGVRTTFQNVEFYDVYLITTDKGFQYWDILNQGAEDMANLIGVRYVWEAPEERSTREQIEIINRAVENGAEALIIAADDPKYISGPVEDAKAKGVKVIYVDSPAYEEAITTLTTDNYRAGEMAAETLLTVLADRGISSGAIGIINLTEKENTNLRELGFRDTLAGYPEYRLIETSYTQNDLPLITQEAAQKLMDQNEDLIALFGTSEGTTIGVGRANQANQNRYVVVGFDLTDENSRLLRKGSLQAVVDQNPYTMGYLGMAQAVAAIAGKDTGPDYIDTGASVVYGRRD